MHIYSWNTWKEYCWFGVIWKPKIGILRTVELNICGFLGQTSKPVYIPIIPTVSVSNQPIPHSTGVVDNWKLSLIEVVLILVSNQFCFKSLPPILSMALHALEFSGYSTSKYHKNIDNGFPLSGLHKNLLWFQSALKPVYIVQDTVFRNICGEYC